MRPFEKNYASLVQSRQYDTMLRVSLSMTMTDDDDELRNAHIQVN